jgi:hypothetical protein
LFYENYDETKLIRLCGVGFSNLKDKIEVIKLEYNLFTYEDFAKKDESIKKTLKEIQDKYGVDLIQLGIKEVKEE